MGRTMRGVAVVGALLATSASAQTWTIPQGEFQAFGDLKWKPNCDRYWRPYLRDEGNQRRAAEEWLSCVNRQARNDVEVASLAISQGREAAINEKLKELRGY